MKSSSLAIYVMSCDKTADVAAHFISGFNKYWPDCPYHKFLGAGLNYNSQSLNGFELLPSTLGNWREETLEQIKCLRRLAPDVTHLLVFLDDFILSERVEDWRMRKLLCDAAEKNILNLRMKPLEEGVWGRLMQYFRKKVMLGEENCFLVRKDHPYYCSLKLALWQIDYLVHLLEESKDIWNFERINTSCEHYCVSIPVVHYRHIVEKGRWDIGAAKYCMRVLGCFEAGKRPHHHKRFARLRRVLDGVRFWLFGYSLMRLKRRVLG